MNYEECVDYIWEIPKFAGKNDLSKTLDILSRLIDVTKLPPVIHVAGTNGKGSVCTFISSIMKESGIRYGVFISPHLTDIRERICIGGEMIEKNRFADAFLRVKNVIGPDNHPSFFEYLFLMAMVYFYEEKPDYIILETGLGGRLDATNCLNVKKTAVITEIGFDHMQYLGNTFESIAMEKAGIIKSGDTVIYMDKRPEATKAIEQRVASLDHVKAVRVNPDNIDIKAIAEGIDFSLLDLDGRNYNQLHINTFATYQCENAALAIGAVNSLKDNRIAASHIQNGIRNMFWPARMQKIGEDVFLDGAHNEDGIDALLDSIEKSGCLRNVLMFGVVNDKNYEKMVKKITESGLFEGFVVTTLTGERATGIEEMKKIWGQNTNKTVIYEADIAKAYEKLLAIKPCDGHAFISGSLYLAGEILNLL